MLGNLLEALGGLVRIGQQRSADLKKLPEPMGTPIKKELPKGFLSVSRGIYQEKLPLPP